MNSKNFFLCLLLFMIVGCGVKADPVKYPETAIDSYIQGYTGSESTPEEREREKRNKDSIDTAKKQESDKTPTP